ncbi:MAG: efflux RND transporter permease subunit, partial [Phycisphaeraceae bacterium]|nr:efflux RND transporter permease subunit [Phycisphaeraceae bacterium]
GWAYQYVLVTGPYCPEHPQGLWHDPADDRWYESPDQASDSDRLVHHRIFPTEKAVWTDPETGRVHETAIGLDPKVKQRLRKKVIRPGIDRCPIHDTPLKQPDLDLSDLRRLQDWYLRFELSAVDGVSEVAPVGGFVKQYQVVLDPNRLLAFDLSLPRVKQAIRRSNLDVGGRLIERSETEFMVRGLGYLGSVSEKQIAEAARTGRTLDELRTQQVISELKQVALGATTDGHPIRLSDVAEVRTGPEMRRGIGEWNGEGETVGAVVVVRFGENARAIIQGAEKRLRQLEEGLPPGVAVRTAYDRSDLIHRAIETLSATLLEEMLIVALVCIVFLLHARSILVAVVVLPAGVLMSLLLMYLLDIQANIMSLGGIAIAIGVMVDSSIVMVENAHKHLADRRGRSATAAITDAATEVGPSLFFALLIITVSFLPIFALTEESGRLFKPLAWTKTFAMAAAAILSVTVIPVLMSFFVRERILPDHWSKRKTASVTAASVLLPAAAVWAVPVEASWKPWLLIGWAALAAVVLIRQKIVPENRQPLGRLARTCYRPIFALSVRIWPVVILVAVAMIGSMAGPIKKIGSEFMPPLEEGDLLYMPTTDPGISMTKARELLQQTDRLIMKFPEVASVFGKAGRAETATDPAPPSMLETTIILHRDKSKWRRVPRTFEQWPWGTRWLGRLFLARTRPITQDELI